MKCNHPIKAMRVMRDFLNTAIDLETIITYGRLTENNKIEWYDKIVKQDVKLIKDNSFKARMSTIEEETVEIHYDKNFDFSDIGSKCFRKNLIKRFPSGQGFASITLALLHELGHFETDYAFDEEYDNEKEIKLWEILMEAETEEEEQEMYFALPDETMATDWAINWLSDSENRKIAKAFEKKFFACFN